MKFERNVASGTRARIASMRWRNRSPSPHRRIRRSSGRDTCWSDRSKYGTPRPQMASAGPPGGRDGRGGGAARGAPEAREGAEAAGTVAALGHLHVGPGGGGGRSGQVEEV